MTELGTRMLTLLVCLKTSSQSDCLLGEGGALWEKKIHIKNVPEAALLWNSLRSQISST